MSREVNIKLTKPKRNFTLPSSIIKIGTGEQLKSMEKNHCDDIQGNFFSPPVPADQFVTLLLEQDSKKLV